MHPEIQGFYDPATSTVSYVVYAATAGACAIIDPVLDSDAAAGRISTQGADRIAAFVESRGLTVHWLLETHAQKCDEGGDCANDRPRHVISEVYGTSANIDSLAICEIEMGTQIYLVLDDHSAFRIAVEAVSP